MKLFFRGFVLTALVDIFLTRSGLADKGLKNVLMVVVDDLRPMISQQEPEKWGYMHTPNLNAFMNESLVMRQSHTQQALCSASRASVLTGRRPDTAHVYDLHAYFRDTGCAGCLTIPQLFLREGYRAYGYGKVFHPGTCSGGGMTDPYSWNYSYYGDDYWLDYLNKSNTWYAVTPEQEDFEPLQDTDNLNHAIEALRVNISASNDSSPWFLGVGFHKPHLPFIFPEHFLELYAPETITPPSNPYAPAGMPEIAFASYEMQNYIDVQETNFTGTINESMVTWKALEEIRAYQAGVSYMDSIVGQLFDELKALDLWRDTIVCFWGDHGWKLGEHGAWAKHTNFYVDTVSPLMIRIPGVTDIQIGERRGILANGLVEHVDIMPSLAEAAGLEQVPLCPKDDPWLTDHCTEGTSFLPLIELAQHDSDAPWKNATFSQYIRDIDSDNPIMGYSITTATKWRFTAWVDFNLTTNSTLWVSSCTLCGFELYDHSSDADENVNLAYHDEYNDTVTRLYDILKIGWRASLPNKL